MNSIVCKFGGTSVADSEKIKGVVSIIRSDSRRKLVVVSAPGKRFKEDEKITDLLYKCHEEGSRGKPVSGVFSLVKERYNEISENLGIGSKLREILEEIEENIKSGATADYTASRGEFLCALLLAEYLGAEFVDAADIIKLNENGTVDKNTYNLIGERVEKDKSYVIPGFYGSTSDGEIKVFSRGGSDITGALVARGTNASLYENWTDVSGILTADPRVVQNPIPIDRVTYRELRELAYLGASVFHEEAIFPVSEAGIPINIRNTNYPDHPGTTIVKEREVSPFPFTGLAGKTGFSLFYIEKLLLNREEDFISRLFSILRENKVNPRYIQSGCDSLIVVLGTEEIKDRENNLLKALKERLKAEHIKKMGSVALLGAVGEGISKKPEITSRLLNALVDSGLSVSLVEQGSSENSILFGVKEEDYEKSLKALYKVLA